MLLSQGFWNGNGWFVQDGGGKHPSDATRAVPARVFSLVVSGGILIVWNRMEDWLVEKFVRRVLRERHPSDAMKAIPAQVVRGGELEGWQKASLCGTESISPMRTRGICSLLIGSLGSSTVIRMRGCIIGFEGLRIFG